jgi:alkaline phosphatase D
MKLIIPFLFAALITLPAFPQQSTLVSGPMQGHVTATSAKIQLLVSKTKKINFSLVSKSQGTATPVKLMVDTDTLQRVGQQFPVIITFEHLLPDTEYELSLQLDNTLIARKYTIKTLKQADVADFSFLTGSCALQLPAIVNLFTRAGSDRIFKHMLTVPADFMIWLGDYTYYKKNQLYADDFSSAETMWKRQMKTRKIKRMNDFLVRVPQYAIWDDHDYGPYDGDGSFVLKDTSLFIHKKLWANPSYGLPNVKGIFTSFRKYDSDFFLLDDRFYRSAPNVRDGTMLGTKQLDWLFEGLKKSDATFKFIILGSQFLNPCSKDECYNQFPEEKKKIYDFLERNNLQGVIFITGDAHYADLQKEPRKNTYPLYDFTCSPLTSFLDSPTPIEKANTFRVPGTLTHQRNFGKISVTGAAGKRVCTIELFDENAELLWKHTIPEETLR